MKIHEWIMVNLNLANSLGSQGLILVDMTENDLTLQQVDHLVEYAIGETGETLVRIDHIDKLPGRDKIRDEAINRLARKFGISHDHS